jgi:hypothetical protein
VYGCGKSIVADVVQDVVPADSEDVLRTYTHTPLPQQEEELSTDAPSCSSDAETTGSSDAEATEDEEDQRFKLHPGWQCTPQSVLSPSKGKMRKGKLRLSLATRSKQHGRGARFDGTPLEPIPGTPVGMSEHPPLLFSPSDECEEKAKLQEETAMNFGKDRGVQSRSSWKILLATVPESKEKVATGHSREFWLPLSPKRRARAAALQKAKAEGMPLMVSMITEDAAFKRRDLDPEVPAKKRPILAESAFAPSSLQPGVPVKKRVTPWLLAEPASVLPAAPR